MTDLLLDTSVLIDHMRGFIPATEFLETIFNGGVLASISIMSETELYAGKSMQDPHNEKPVAALLDFFNIIPINRSIARQAGVLLRDYRSRGLTPVDAVIAATAFEVKANLITRNVKHFRMIKGLIVFNLPEQYV